MLVSELIEILKRLDTGDTIHVDNIDGNTIGVESFTERISLDAPVIKGAGRGTQMNFYPGRQSRR